MSKIALLFPGQGAQHVGMGQSLHASVPAARDLFERASGVLGYDLAELCFHGPQARLDTTDHSQPALLVASLAAVEQLRIDQPEIIEQVGACAGLSLGEYTALAFAGALTFEDAVRVVRARGEAMQAAAAANPSGMVSVLGLDLAAVAAVCDQARRPNEVLQIANHLCPGNVVVSGSIGSCQEVPAAAATAGGKAVALAVAGAFHTPLMQSAQPRLHAALDQVEWRPPRIPIVSNVTAEPQQDPHVICGLLVNQVVQTVQWEASIRWLVAAGYDRFFEVGPGRVLRGLMRRIDRQLDCESVSA